MKNQIYVIIESEENIAREADIFFSAKDAGEFLQRKTNDLVVGFRNKREDETWEKYLCAWDIYAMNSNADILKTGTWNIAWFETNNVHWPDNVAKNSTHSVIADLYYAIIKHAGYETLDQSEICEALKKAKLFLINSSDE